MFFGKMLPQNVLHLTCAARFTLHVPPGADYNSLLRFCEKVYSKMLFIKIFRPDSGIYEIYVSHFFNYNFNITISLNHNAYYVLTC